MKDETAWWRISFTVWRSRELQRFCRLNWITVQFVLLWILTVTVVNADENPWLVVTEYLPPFQYPTSDGRVAGTMTTAVKEIIQKSSLEADIVILPWARAELMARTRPNTLIYSILRTKEREDVFHWIGPIGVTDTGLFKLTKNTSIRLDSLNDIHRELIAVTRGDVSAQYLKSKLPLSNFQENIATIDSVRMLLLGRVDLLPANDDQLYHYCLVIGCKSTQFQRVLDLHELEQVLYIAANKDSDPQMLSKLSKTTAALMVLGGKLQ